MKKLITSICIFTLLMLIFLLSVTAQAAADQSGVVRSVSLHSYPDKTVYGAFEQLDTDGLSLLATFSDGSEKII